MSKSGSCYYAWNLEPDAGLAVLQVGFGPCLMHQYHCGHSRSGFGGWLFAVYMRTQCLRAPPIATDPRSIFLVGRPASPARKVPHPADQMDGWRNYFDFLASSSHAKRQVRALGVVVDWIDAVAELPAIPRNWHKHWMFDFLWKERASRHPPTLPWYLLVDPIIFWFLLPFR